MIRRPEDLSKKALFKTQWKEKSRQTKIQVGGVFGCLILKATESYLVNIWLTFLLYFTKLASSQGIKTKFITYQGISSVFIPFLATQKSKKKNKIIINNFNVIRL
jgi:hypothetical protein